MELIDDENLKSLGEFIPKTLKKIHFNFESVINYEESLRCFLEGYKRNSGSLKSLILKYNDRDGWFSNINNKSLVYEQFGVQITTYDVY